MPSVQTEISHWSLAVAAPQVWEANIAFDPSGNYLALAGYVGYPNPQELPFRFSHSHNRWI